MPSMQSWLFALTCVLALAPCSAVRGASEVPQNPTEGVLLSLLDGAYSADTPGACVIVVKDGEVLFRGARGMANVELGVPLHPQSVLRIGSITKQFTAAAVLLLVREGRLSLSDPVTKYLPGYPTHGETITIRHLLSHTSGIRSYTDIPEWRPTLRTDVSVDQLVDIFKDKPLDFAPGTRWTYSNSGYVLLGAVIERVSGQSYAQFMRTRIFDPLGMKQTRVDVPGDVIPDRAAGYSLRDGRWMNADFLSMTQPYSAGALVSSVDDLARWNAAMENNDILTSDLWMRATTSFALSDGTPTRYGAGWMMGRLGKLATLEHSGGIYGFNGYVLRVPAEHFYVAVLANAAPSKTSTRQLALQLATTVLGISLDTPEVPVGPKHLREYVGHYAAEPEKTRHITLAGNRLRALVEGDKEFDLTPIGRDLFEARDDHSQFQFIRLNGRVSALRIEPRITMGDRTPARRIAD
ncbi:MAG TPA: serine hydrolase domain-containing protein [Povalibacter sp.]|nr:serine hydrolase domain-containing protein [Povalibacter sp.]